MKEKFEYHIRDQENDLFVLKCRAEYDTENSYNTTYFFYDGNEWLKDFIDLSKLSPEESEDNRNFEDFITRVHDYMVHGNIWEEIKEIKDDESVKKDTYKLVINAKKL